MDKQYPSPPPVSRSPGTADLPALSADEQAHSGRLLARIRDEIERAQGWISFARFMEMALYEPGLGYYSAGATKFGVSGDFVTAPEISSLFSRCVANQCAEVFANLDAADIFELGAGSGIMAADVLNELEALDALPGRYLILEPSADLQQRQLGTLAARASRHLKRVEWLTALPESFSGVILANEVVDAIPVERFRTRAGAINALGVTWQLGQLDWSEVHARRELSKRVRIIERELGAPFPEGYTSEVNLRVGAWVRALSETLARGVILLMDYGLPRRQYYRPERHDGTLLCHFRHRFHNNPFCHVGLQDIGAWVDFTALAEAAVDSGLKVAGFSTQAHFLMGLGIERYLADVGERDLAERITLAREAMLLTLPGEMGERFKVLGLTRGIDTELKGFSVRDLAASL